VGDIMKPNRELLMSFLSIILVAGLFTQITRAQNWDRVLNLKGWWKFSIGDDMNWADPSYDDDDWEDIRVPSYWEEEGFYNYNGYAWYRKHFKFPEDFKGSTIYLYLGTIDDVDQVYVNGKLIGLSGSFPPDYQTAYYAYRKYPIQVKYLQKEGNNLIAVRVYDAQMGGGIADGKIGLYYMPHSLVSDVNLEGEWKFKTGDNKEWKNKNIEDKEWKTIIVPGFWESQGFSYYDGFGWYRKSFNVLEKLKNKKLVLMMGKIDDLDEVYLNGQLIGSTGHIYDDPSRNSHSYEYEQFRGYYLPDSLIKYNEENVVAVRVYDDWRDGGIYFGPVGLITQERYTKFWKEIRKRHKNIFEVLFE
jgi:sialate O-acetylesterase